MFKLNEHFKTMVNKDSARSKFDCMTQGDRTVAQYFAELRKQADRCKFADRDDSIRTKILQTMNDKQLRREAEMSIARQVAKNGSQQGGCRTTGEGNGEKCPR